MITDSDTDSEELFEENISRVESELLWRRADIVESGRWSLYRRLMDTFDLLEAWQQPFRVRLAGALNTAYDSCGAQNVTLFARSERTLVAELAGRDRERLVSLLCSTDKAELVSAARRMGDQRDAVVVQRDGSQCTVSARELGDMLVIHLASIAQSSAPDGGPTPWLAEASMMAAYARPYAEVTPPIFGSGTVILDQRDDERLVASYLRLLEATFESCEPYARELREITKTTSYVAEPFIWLGLLALALGDCPTAAAFGDRAREALNIWNTAWDKRLAGGQWLALASFLQSAGPLVGRERDFLASRVRSLLESASWPDGVYAQLDALDALGEAEVIAPGLDLPDEVSLAEAEWSEFDVLPTRFGQYIAGLRENHDRPLMGFYPGLTARPWWDPNELELVAELERESSSVVAEYLELSRDLFLRHETHIPYVGGWEVYRLSERGRLIAENAASCPRTAAIVERFCKDGSAYFARLGPGARTAPWSSTANTLLRCQLSLVASAEGIVTVDGIQERMRYRRCVVFDESFVHNESNLGTGECAALVVQFWHPDLRSDEITLLQGLNRMMVARTAALRRAG